MRRVMYPIQPNPPLSRGIRITLSRMIALSTPEWLDLAVALGTGLLAMATATMALQARSQARATAKLAEVAEHDSKLLGQQYRAQNEPRIRWARNPAGEVFAQTSTREFGVPFEWVAGPPAEIQSAGLGGRAAKIISNRVSQGTRGQVSFKQPQADAWGPLELRVEYRSVESGTPGRPLTAQVRWDGRRNISVENLDE